MSVMMTSRLKTFLFDDLLSETSYQSSKYFTFRGSRGMFEGAVADKCIGPRLGRTSTRILTMWLPGLLNFVALVFGLVCVGMNGSDVSPVAHNVLCTMAVASIVMAATLPTTASLLCRQVGVVSFNDASAVVEAVDLAAATEPSKRIGFMMMCWFDLILVPVGIAASPHVLGDPVRNSITLAAEILLLHPNSSFAEGTFWLVIGLGGFAVGLVGYCGWVLYRETSNPYNMFDETGSPPRSLYPTLLTALSAFVLPVALFEAAWVMPCADTDEHVSNSFLKCRSASHLTYVMVGLFLLCVVLIPIHRFSVMRLRLLSPDSWVANTPRDRHVTVRPLFLHALLSSRLVKLCVVPVFTMALPAASPWLVGTALSVPVLMDLVVWTMCSFSSSPVVAPQVLLRPIKRIYMFVLLLDVGTAVVVGCRGSLLITESSLALTWWLVYAVCVALPVLACAWRDRCASLRSWGESWELNATTDDDTLFEGEVRPVF